MLFNVVKCNLSSMVGMYMFLYFKKHLPVFTNVHIRRYKYAYTSDFPSLFNISASLFVKDLEVWFNLFTNLASFEEDQAR